MSEIAHRRFRTAAMSAFSSLSVIVSWEMRASMSTTALSSSASDRTVRSLNLDGGRWKQNNKVSRSNAPGQFISKCITSRTQLPDGCKLLLPGGKGFFALFPHSISTAACAFDGILLHLRGLLMAVHTSTNSTFTVPV